MMTVREMNRRILTGKPVTAEYKLDGVAGYGRIICARLHGGVIQVKPLGTQRWATLIAAYAAK